MCHNGPLFPRQSIINTLAREVASPITTNVSKHTAVSDQHGLSHPGGLLYFKVNLTSKYKTSVCTLKNYNLNSREKFKPGQGFEPRGASLEI